MTLLLALFAACLPVQSDRITAEDVARAVPAFRALPPSQVLSYAPLPGHSRVFPRAELMQRVPAAANDLPESVCFEWPMRALPADEMEAAMLSALPAGSSVDVVDTSRWPVPPGRVEFAAAGLKNGLWKGHVAWAAGRKFDVWARVVVKAPFTRVVAVAPIRVGQRIAEASVRVETGSGEPLPPGVASDVSEVVGRIARRLIAAGAGVPAAALDKETTIARGDPVAVQVVAGNARLAFDGVAEGRGGVGDVVPVRNPATKRLVHARVEGPGTAVAVIAP